MTRACQPCLPALLLTLGMGVLACGDSEDASEEGTTAGGDGTSGGEAGGGGIEAPPGSVQPGDEGWDDDPDPGSEPGGAADPGEPGSGSASQESPWGSPVAETGRPLPPRRPMNGSARGYYQQGIRAAQVGDSASATTAFQQALSADARAYKAAYNLGVMADRSGNEGRALEYYRRALSVQPDYERAAQGIVTIHVRRANVNDAIAFIEPLARQWQRNLFLQALYAETLVHANRLDDAVTAARGALRRDERFVPAMVAIVKASLKRGRTELAQAVLVQALGIDDNNAELHYLKGRMLLAEEGRLREALGELRRAVTLRPDYAEARMALGIQLMAGGNYTDALTEFQAAARLAPTLVEVHLNLGDAHRANKQWKQAKSSFDHALRLRSRLPEAHFNLGLMYLTAGEGFPGLDRLGALQKAQQEFTRYRDMMGPRLEREDPSVGYLEDLNRQIEREQKRIERDRARAQRDAERAARQAEEAAGGGGGQ